jgi:hypothetical protein
VHQFPGLDLRGVRPKPAFEALNGSFHLNAIDYFAGNCTSYRGLRGSGCSCDFRKLGCPELSLSLRTWQTARVKLSGLSWQAPLGAASPHALVNKNMFERYSRRPFHKANRPRNPLGRRIWPGARCLPGRPYLLRRLRKLLSHPPQVCAQRPSRRSSRLPLLPPSKPTRTPTSAHVSPRPRSTAQQHWKVSGSS